MAGKTFTKRTTTVPIEIEVSSNGVWLCDEKHKVLKFVTNAEILRSAAFTQFMVAVKKNYNI